MAAFKKSELSASLEDYLEAIFNLSGGAETARSKEIARVLGVSKASVTGALRVLKRKGLVNYKPYDTVTLTEKGKATAAEIARKHEILKSFFINVLGVKAEVGQQAACKAEHALGPEISTRLLSFIKFITAGNGTGGDVVDKFKKFYRKNFEAGKKSRK